MIYKCKNCGGEVEPIEEDSSIGKCKYCNSTMPIVNLEKIEKDKKKVLKIGKKIAIGYTAVFGIIFIVALAVIVFTFITITKGFKENNPLNNNTNQINKVEKMAFNSIIEMYMGTQTGFNISILLDNVANSNNKNSEHKITLVNNGISTSTPNEIRDLKNKFNDMREYEVTLDYDSDGYVNMVTIK